MSWAAKKNAGMAMAGSAQTTAAILHTATQLAEAFLAQRHTDNTTHIPRMSQIV